MRSGRTVQLLEALVIPGDLKRDLSGVCWKLVIGDWNIQPSAIEIIATDLAVKHVREAMVRAIAGPPHVIADLPDVISAPIVSHVEAVQLIAELSHALRPR